MNIKFEKIHLHNFLSFGDSELDLTNKGYCIVKGVNNNPKDSALSNGSGKSSIWSGISWALFGETIQGLKTNIVNIYGDDGCFVKLDFSVGADKYEVTRYREYAKVGTDLKIVVNGEDRSGKGIRDSQKLLEEYLPEVNTDLLGSVIILGQGLPHKFSNHSPSGRKEVLERLSKSDFMIQDIRSRIDARLSTLTGEKRTLEDKELTLRSQVRVYGEQVVKAREDLAAMNVTRDFDEEIKLKAQELAQVELEHKNLQEHVENLTKTINNLNGELLQETNKKTSDLEIISNEYVTNITPIQEHQTEINKAIYATDTEIIKLKAISDTCPTCKQKLQGVVKPDTSDKEVLLSGYKEHSAELTTKLSELKTKFESSKAALEENFKLRTNNITVQITDTNNKLREIQMTPRNILFLEGEKLRLGKAIVEIESAKKSFDDNRNRLIKTISDLDETIATLNSEVLTTTQQLEVNQQHLDVVNKMITYIRRDFRGFLLLSVIEFIDEKAKEYSNEVFGTSELDFKLDGNNIDITYSGKSFENLSGGEKQRVDLILQFAIRDMMSQYLSFTSNILVLDEIFDNLDAMGTTNVLNLISNKLTDVESTFIISHNESLDIPHDNILTVVKDGTGVSSLR